MARREPPRSPPSPTRSSALTAAAHKAQPTLQLPEPLETGLELWRAAARWRREIDSALAPFELTLSQWLVLCAANALIRETHDAVSQNAIARRAEMDKMTVSQIMKALEKRGFIDRAPAVERFAYRVLLTRSGSRALARATPRAAEASRASLGGVTLTTNLRRIAPPIDPE